MVAYPDSAETEPVLDDITPAAMYFDAPCLNTWRRRSVISKITGRPVHCTDYESMIDEAVPRLVLARAASCGAGRATRNFTSCATLAG